MLQEIWFLTCHFLLVSLDLHAPVISIFSSLSNYFLSQDLCTNYCLSPEHCLTNFFPSFTSQMTFYISERFSLITLSKVDSSYFSFLCISVNFFHRTYHNLKIFIFTCFYFFSVSVSRLQAP